MPVSSAAAPPLSAPTASAPPDASPWAKLTDEQRAAVEHGGARTSQPLLIIAGAGSGKTLTLAARVARLIAEGADPQRVLLLTFSRRAAAEMTRRAGRLLHQALGWALTREPPQLPWAGTFHAVGARLIRDYAGAIGLPEGFTILDRGDAEDLMALARHEQGFASTDKRFPGKGTALAIYSRRVNTCLALEPLLAEHYPWCLGWQKQLRQLFGAYVDAKQRLNVLDYDDLLLYWLRMLEVPQVAEHLRQRFDHVLVDEYQDTNRLQSAILGALCPQGQGLTVVGDDAQAIYSFRAAEVRNILDFPQQFQPAARVVTLTRNYRSSRQILAAANAVIGEAAERFTKHLWSDTDGPRPRLVHVDDEMAQAQWVGDDVLRLREEGLALKQQAVLFRAGHHSAALELELTRRRIPFVKFGGLKFLEAAHVKDVLGILRWLRNPRNRLAGFRVATLVPGLGPASARRVLDHMDAAADPRAAMTQVAVPPSARPAWQDWLDLATTIDLQAWPQAIEQAAQWYRPHLHRIHEDAEVRWLDVEQLTRMAAAHAGCERFLAEITLDPPEATSDEAGAPHRDEDYLVLSTMHSAKGQEWSAVSILNVVDGCIPSDLGTGSAPEIDEERRLLYVAMTRAKRHLSLLVPQRFHVTQQRQWGDRHVYAGRSRFIRETHLGHFDEVGPPPATQPAAAAAMPCATPVADVRAMVRAGF
jgi:DNA helicase-2/ATP-dependent DNA helicase PcrA